MNDILDIEIILKRKQYPKIYNIGIILIIILLIITYMIFTYKYQSYYITYGKIVDNKLEDTMEKGEYFVLGDNRGDSVDSEDYGPIQESMIYGKVVLLITDGKYKTKF